MVLLFRSSWPSRPGSRPVALLCVVRAGLALAGFAVVAAAGPTQAGETTGFAFLNLPAGARAAALGGAFTAVADDPTALFWNPAGLAPPARVSGRPNAWSLTAVHHESIQGFRQEVVGAVLRRGEEGISLGFNTHYTDGIDQRDDLGNPLGSFGVSDFAVAGGYGGTLAAGLRLGAGVQWVHEIIAGTGASGLSLSAGGLYALPGLQGLTLGAAVLNVGGSPSFQTESGGAGEGVPQPLAVSGGASYTGAAGSMRFLVTADARKLKGDPLECRFGGELAPVPMLALRVGWMLGQDAADFTAGAGITAGSIAFDYAFVIDRLEAGFSG